MVPFNHAQGVRSKSFSEIRKSQKAVMEVKYMKMVNAKGEAVYFNRVMKNGREQFVVKALSGQHIMGRDRQKHNSRTFTELHQAEAFLRRAGYKCKG
nr:MAG TPA_asm: hypothetical protein [Caudoviricetes sp.]